MDKKRYMSWYEIVLTVLSTLLGMMAILLLAVNIPAGLFTLVLSISGVAFTLSSFKNRINNPILNKSQKNGNNKDIVKVSIKINETERIAVNNDNIDWDTIDKSTLPIANVVNILDNPAPDVVFKGNRFCFTGFFDMLGKPRDIVEERGGILLKYINDEVDYLVIGKYVAPGSSFENYGYKVEQALSYNKNKRKHRIKIISEDHWAKFI